jgi:hypothetical protein
MRSKRWRKRRRGISINARSKGQKEDGGEKRKRIITFVHSYKDTRE